MRRVPALVGVSLLLAAVSSSAQRADPTGATVALQGVVRSATGVALRSARIAVQLTNGAPRVRVAADESGRFSVKLPGSVPYRLTAAKPGYAPVTLANEAGIRADATTDIVLEKGAAISGSVVDRFGDPMVSLTVFVIPTDVGRSTEEHATLTDERGAFRVGSLADGEYQLQLSRAPAVFNSEQGGLTVPHIDNYQSTMSPRTVFVARHEDTQLNLVFDAGPNRVELGAVAVDSFMRDRERDGRAASRVDANATIIEGWVATATGRVARGAVVELEPVTPGPPRRTSADADGHYRFDDVNPGRYAIWARRDGFSPKQFDQSMRPTGQVIRVQPRVPATASLTMSSGSVVSGIVVDRFGDPIEGAAVELQTVSFASGRGILRGAGSPADVRTTDDLGRYSFPEVDTGTYYVAARDGADRIFYPDVASVAQAQAVSVDERRDHLNIDLQFHPVASGRVEGKALDETRSPAATTVTMVESARAGALVAVTRSMVTKTGDFVFEGLPPGQYTIQAVRDPPPGTPLEFLPFSNRPTGAWADAAAVSVDPEETTRVVLQPRAPQRIRGRFQIPDWREATAPTVVLRPIPADPDVSPVGSMLSDVDLAVAAGSSPQVMPSDGDFDTGLISGPFRLRMARVPNGWWLQSVVVDGIDVTRSSMTLTKSIDDVVAIMSTDGATLSGTVVDERTALAGVTVIAFSVDPGLWFFGSQYVRRTQTPRDGAFSFYSLPPGDYFVAALDDVPIDPGLSDWQSVQALAALSGRATRVTLAPSQKRSMDLRLAP